MLRNYGSDCYLLAMGHQVSGDVTDFVFLVLLSEYIEYPERPFLYIVIFQASLFFLVSNDKKKHI